jgi:hypothetical protein
MSLISYKRGQGSVVIRVKILNSSVSTGAGLAGLTSTSTGLIIGVIADNEATTTSYTVAGSTIETISTLGTFAAPTSTKCRFKEVDATYHKGVYEIQIADARFAVSSAKSVLISISGATNAAETDAIVPTTDMDPYDAVHGGMSAIPATACTTNGSLLTVGTGIAQIDVTSGQVNLGKILGTTSVGTAGYMAPDWGHVNAPTTTVNLSGTTIATTQQVDVQTIKTQTITCTAGVTFPTVLASPTNITAGTIATVTTVTTCTYLTNAPTTGDLTAAMKTSVTTAATAATPTITLPSIPTNWITAGGINAAAFNSKGDWTVGKAGYALAANGLDSVTMADVAGVPSTFPQLVVQLWNRLLRKSVKDAGAGTLTNYAANGSTVLTTQTWTDDGAGNETLGSAS